MKLKESTANEYFANNFTINGKLHTTGEIKAYKMYLSGKTSYMYSYDLEESLADGWDEAEEGENIYYFTDMLFDDEVDDFVRICREADIDGILYNSRNANAIDTVMLLTRSGFYSEGKTGMCNLIGTDNDGEYDPTIERESVEGLLLYLKK